MTTQTPGRGSGHATDRVLGHDGHRHPTASGRCSSQAIDIEMTSIVDGLTHTVTAADFDAGIWLGQGRYRAACGDEMIVAAMSSKPGPRCRRCPPLPSREIPRTGLLARLIAAVSDQ